MLWILIAVLLVAIWWYWRRPEAAGTERWRTAVLVAVGVAALAGIIWVFSHHATGTGPGDNGPYIPPGINQPR
ncbi:hypothetical protein [Nocardia sp. NPDC004722]